MGDGRRRGWIMPMKEEKEKEVEEEEEKKTVSRTVV